MWSPKLILSDRIILDLTVEAAVEAVTGIWQMVPLTKTIHAFRGNVEMSEVFGSFVSGFVNCFRIPIANVGRTHPACLFRLACDPRGHPDTTGLFPMRQ